LLSNRKYILDPSDLQYKRVRLPWKQKLARFSIWFVLSVVVSIGYFKAFDRYFGSPKEKKLEQQADELKFRYSLLDRKFKEDYRAIKYFQLSDEIRFRPVLNMDTISSTFRNPGYGGVDRYREFKGLANGQLIISAHEKLDDIRNLATVQKESFKSISERSSEWINEFEHIPWICPVDISFPRGDGIKFREVHPVYGTPAWHWGQDFNCPYGTEVYATGDGKVIYAGKSDNGFGYYVEIDHGYGFQSIYGHLSKINVPVGMNIKRGDMLGLSGNSGTSSGPHLHYQIELNGAHQNPLNFFNDDLSREEYFKMITQLSSKSKFR
jgi:murein DD-endopeptidase MepM/ murein hydrolase activator NlpD